MAQRLVWSHQALRQKQEIFDYWNKRNKSKVFSRKLSKLFDEALEQLELHPYIGKPTSIEGAYIIRVRQFFVLYRLKQESILVAAIWDGRRDIPLP